MQTAQEPLETIHLYVVREQEKKPSVFLPLVAAFLCLAALVGVTIYSAFHPTYEQETLTLPATFLPLQTFSATEPIIPTGVKTSPATTAHGTLTLTNGSVETLQLPPGMILSGKGSEVITDGAVLVPPGSAEGYGVATVSAHALVSGSQGNISPLTINAVYGTSLYIRNLHAFTGGRDAYSVKDVTAQDRQTALDAAKASVTVPEARTRAMLAKPCTESLAWHHTLQLSWTCQFIAYPNVPGKIIALHFDGKHVVVEIVFVARPKSMKRG